MRFRTPVVVAALLMAAAMPAAANAGAGGSHAARSEHDRILAYWTPQRIANAKPRDYVKTPAGTFTLNPRPNAKPGSGGGVVGASWTGGGIVEKQTGRILFSDASGDWICSGSILSDGSTTDAYSLVLSAGHCAYDGSGGWAFNWMFMPDFDAAPTYTCANTKYGCWTASALVLSKAFVDGGGFGNDTVGYDWSIGVVGPGGLSGSAKLDALGSYQLKTTNNQIGDTAWPFGYPAAGKYHGTDLTYCKGTTSADPYGAPTWGVACDMTGGSSGGPWLVGTTNPGTTAGSVASLNSYGYSGLKYMFGPIFNSNTQAVYNAANAYNGSGTNHITVP